MIIALILRPMNSKLIMKLIEIVVVSENEALFSQHSIVPYIDHRIPGLNQLLTHERVGIVTRAV